MQLLMTVSAVAMMSVLGGCSNMHIERITDANRATAEGLRYWRPAPYLSVAMGADKVCTASIIYLPDRSEEYVITTTAGFGSITFKPNLQDGWNLIGLDTTIDNTKVSDVLGLVSKAAGLSTADSRTSFGIKPGLYKLTMQTDGSIKLGDASFATDTECTGIGVSPPAKKPSNK